MTTALAAMLLAAALAAPSYAAGAKKEAPAQESGEEGGLFNQTRSVTMPPLLAPLFDENQRLTGYAYLQLDLRVRGDIWRVRERIAFIQDAFVREVYAVSIAQDANPREIDPEKVRTHLLARAREVMGNDQVADVKLTSLGYATH